MKHIASLQRFCVAVIATAAIYGCKENIDTSARYVFKHDSILSYLQKKEVYSEYVKLLGEVQVSSISMSTVAQLLSARGHYTVFAPTNEAIEAYLQTVFEDDSTLMSGPTWDDFYSEHKRDSIRKVIVYNSIIDSGDDEDYYELNNFPTTDKAEFPRDNMMSHKLSVHYSADYPDSIYINTDCPISLTHRDILCLNGVVHQMEKAIVPRDVTAASYILNMLDKKQEGFLVMCKVVQACGLLDTLSKIRDEVYESLYQRGLIANLMGMTRYGFAQGSIGYAPMHRNYGFTIFSETDEFWRSQGLDPMEASAGLLPKLQQWIYDNKQYSEEYDHFNVDENYTSPDNLLYQWITYHILPMRMPTDRLVFHISENGYFRLQNPYQYGIPVYEYYATFGKRRLMKLYESAESDGVYLNRFPKLDNGRRGTGHETGCDADKVGNRVNRESELAIVNDMVNCCIYPIDKPLAYTDQVRNNLGKERIRFDGMSLFPEAMNSDFRLKAGSKDERNVHVYIPNTITSYNYLHDMQMNEATNFVYYNVAYTETWQNWQTDEMKAVGRYEIMVTLPPVPRRGIYEFRYDVIPTVERGIMQVYFGDDPTNLPPAGIPLDLTMSIWHPLFGSEADSGDDDYDAEVDKRLRNNGVMKGSLSVTTSGSPGENERKSGSLRRIMWRGMMDPDKTYYVKTKSVLDSDQKEFYMDYMEFCPKEVYDNPETPEDIW